jgi:NADH:ubiquinone oxidoreductase subunit 4 (subunit M)
MSLISYIENLRTKSESERKKIAIGVAVGVTVVIFSLWIFTTISSFSHRSPSTDKVAETGAYDDIKKSWSLIVDNMSTLFSGLAGEATTSIEAPTQDTYLDAMEGIPADNVSDTVIE